MSATTTPRLPLCLTSPSRSNMRSASRIGERLIPSCLQTASFADALVGPKPIRKNLTSQILNSLIHQVLLMAGRGLVFFHFPFAENFVYKIVDKNVNQLLCARLEHRTGGKRNNSVEDEMTARRGEIDAGRLSSS